MRGKGKNFDKLNQNETKALATGIDTNNG